jgi:pilus assembly protein Flp/PilA
MLTRWNLLAAYLRARFGDTERGAALVEYALLVSLIAIVCIGAVTLLGNSARNKFNEIGSSIGKP